MKYLCIGYLNPEKMDARPKEEIEAVMKECALHMEELDKSGSLILDAGVRAEVKGVQRENGRIAVLDDPSANTNERIGSVFFIEADNIEEAIRIASLHPTIQVAEGERLGWRLEIRPVHYFKN
ncbi:YciI family protein [Metabacillus sp. GX 13764]|uniref:YciI family protein n=1 Tax=Metabacillus kandeliae TaxID=2900151 RepID=UPI001E29F1BF|nr:YciI family protein [Metabacillus kandeliae]MCD7036420.1 YciI family protein [Metabacillus kandeliae]